MPAPQHAATSMAEARPVPLRRWRAALLDHPDVWGVESIKVGYVLVRLTTRTVPARQWDVARALRRHAAEALANAGMTPSVPVPGS